MSYGDIPTCYIYMWIKLESSIFICLQLGTIGLLIKIICKNYPSITNTTSNTT